MQCPSCALYHPPRYDRCVSCGTKLVADGQLVQSGSGAGPVDTGAPAGGGSTASGGGGRRRERKGGMPLALGIGIAGFILCASAGGTFFYLTKPPENERLFQEGQKQLQLGQYAFAVKTLTEASKTRQNDPRVLLSLARAYVGIDQVDKASECIGQAQQLGAGVMADPELASQLANYYRQHNQYDKAVDLLRPLAQSSVGGKKAELADLDAAWGDEAIRSGNYRQAMTCWEEVKDLHEGTRYTEAETRLSTIYQKIADEMSVKGDAEEALKYYSRLNQFSPSPGAFEKCADLYEKQGKYELAIDQLRRAIKMSSDNSFLSHKLAALMVKRGKEMLDNGEADSGYGYLQEAQSLDPRAKAPSATVRNMHLDVDTSGSTLHFNGEVWNPGIEPLNSLSLRAELFDTKLGKAIWTKEHRVIDEFVPPLPSKEARAFDMTANTAYDPKAAELRIYLNGGLYKTYQLTKKPTPTSVVTTSATTQGGTTTDGTATSNGFIRLRPRLAPVATPINPDTGSTTPNPPVAPALAPPTVPVPTATPPVAPQVTPPGPGVEEKTMKDLD